MEGSWNLQLLSFKHIETVVVHCHPGPGIAVQPWRFQIALPCCFTPPSTVEKECSFIHSNVWRLSCPASLRYNVFIEVLSRAAETANVEKERTKCLRSKCSLWASCENLTLKSSSSLQV